MNAIIPEKLWIALLKLVQVHRKHRKVSYLSDVFLFIYVHESEDLTFSEIANELSLNTKQVKDSITELEKFGFLSLEQKNKKQNIKINRYSYDRFDTLISSSILEYSRILEDSSILEYNNINNNKNTEERLYSKYTLKDLENDSDWIKCKEILLKYFKPYQLNVSALYKQQRYEKLFELLHDTNFDLSLYSKWYRVEKYPRCKFNFGIFLHQGVIDEYIDSKKQTTVEYYKTKEISNKDSFKQALKDKKEFLSKLGVREYEKNPI